MNFLSEREKRYIGSVGFLSALCIFFYAYRVFISQSFRFGFVFENLGLAWLGLLFGWLLSKRLHKEPWGNWRNILLTVLWLVFLPNTWYVLTDFLHVLPTGEVSQLYDIVLVSILVITGFTLGMTSLFLVHRELFRRHGEVRSILIVAAIILLVSFGIYLGRDLRWSSWDIITNPSGLILNVSDQIVNPFGHRQAFSVTGLFFVLISSIYFPLWQFFKPRVDRHRS